MALACTVLPMPNEAMAVKKAKSTAIFFHLKPRSSAYIGPPNILPSAVFTLYLMASSPSEYFVAIPNTPVSQHHSTAPGPPKAMAVATPMILPVPMVAANAVASEANCDTSPVAPGSRFTESLMAVKIFRCGNFSRMVKNRCVPRSIIIIGHPHNAELISENNWLIASIILYKNYCVCVCLLLSNFTVTALNPKLFIMFCI